MMKFRRMGYNESMPSHVANAKSPKGDYIMGTGIRVNTPDGVGVLETEIWTTTTVVDVYFADTDDIKSFPAGLVSRYSKRGV